MPPPRNNLSWKALIFIRQSSYTETTSPAPSTFQPLLMRLFSPPLLLGLLASVMLSGCALFGGSKAIDLQLTLQPGDVFILETITDQDIQQTVMGMDQSIDQKIGYTFRQEVSGVTDEGHYQIKVTYDRMLFEQSSTMGSVAYDSQDPPEPVPAQAKGYAAMVGKGFEMTMDQQGEVLRIEGLDAMLDQVLDEVSAEQPMAPEARTTFKQQFGENSMKQNMASLAGFYPDQPVNVGDHWEIIQKKAGATAMRIQTDYVLAKAEEGVLTLGAKGDISPVPDAAPTVMGGMELAYQLSGTQSGTLLVDQATGLLNSGTLTQQVSGTITMTGGPAGEMEWPITIDSEIVMKKL